MKKMLVILTDPNSDFVNKYTKEKQMGNLDNTINTILDSVRKKGLE